MFIGKRDGAIVKRCLKCREKDDRQKRKPDVREVRNARGREQKYYVAYRNKKRLEDPVEYLRNNAARHKAWYHKNKEHVLDWQTNDVNTRIKSLKYGAFNRGYTWDPEMTREVCEGMMRSKCFYCAAAPEGTLHGIDRMDNCASYVRSNSVACCKTCNFMKKCLDARTYVERCARVAAVHGAAVTWDRLPECVDAWPDCMPVSIDSYAARAESKGLAFELDYARYAALTALPCHYCRRDVTAENRSGIDRVDNARGYSEDNVVSCCSECNQMRTLLPQDAFIATCKRVAARAHTIVIPDMPRCMRVITRRAVDE